MLRDGTQVSIEFASDGYGCEPIFLLACLLPNIIWVFSGVDSDFKSHPRVTLQTTDPNISYNIVHLDLTNASMC
jgi:hypothetical protein